MKAVIYARYSSHAQREESIEGQLRECKDFALKNGLTVIGEYCDHALSGKNDNRPEFQRMIKDSEKGHFEAVIMYTLDRFARNRYDSAIYKAKLKKNGIRLFYAKQPMPDTPEGIILESVLEGYAEYYSENLSRSIKRGMKENALHGLAPGQIPPLGYVIGADHKYQVDPLGANIVREIFQRYADGNSAAQIARWCNLCGYKTSRGNEFNKNSLKSILHNEKYIGIYKFMDVVIEGGIPQIVDKALFDKVQAMCKHNYSARARSKAKEDFLLTTKVFCGHCGSRMIGESGTSQSGKIHYYYKCACRKREHACNKINEQKDKLEKFAVRYIAQTVLTDENIELIAIKTMEIIEREYTSNDALSAMKKNYQDITKKIDNLIRAIEDGLYSTTTKTRLSDLESQKHDLEAEIAEAELKKPFLTKAHILFWLNSFKNGDIEDKAFQRRVIDTLLNAMYVFDLPDGGRKFVFTFNLSENNTATVSCSDIKDVSTPQAPLGISKRGFAVFACSISVSGVCRI